MPLFHTYQREISSDHFSWAFRSPLNYCAERHFRWWRALVFFATILDFFAVPEIASVKLQGSRWPKKGSEGTKKTRAQKIGGRARFSAGAYTRQNGHTNMIVLAGITSGRVLKRDPVLSMLFRCSVFRLVPCEAHFYCARSSAWGARKCASNEAAKHTSPHERLQRRETRRCPYCYRIFAGTRFFWPMNLSELAINDQP